MSRRVTEAEIARVLTLISARPNSRRRRRLGDVAGDFDEWFDGGAVKRGTPDTIYVLGDKTRVVASGSGLDLTITFADGTVVILAQR